MEFINVGEITGAHGIRGEVKVTPRTDFVEERFKKGTKLYAKKYKKYLEVVSYKEHKGQLLVKFNGVDDRNSAEDLMFTLLCVDFNDAIPLPAGEYYHFQLKGLEVVEGEISYGKITEIFQTGSNDVYTVKDEATKKEIYIPALKTVIKNVNLEEGKMEVVLPAGLID